MFIVKKENDGPLYHWSAASGEESHHPFCPTRNYFWCKYQVNTDTYKHQLGQAQKPSSKHCFEPPPAFR